MEYLNEQTKLEHPECRCDTPNNIGASNIRPNTPDPNIACPTPICPNPMRLWVIKYAITGTAKFIGQAIVQAPTIEQAQCIFGKDSRFNGYVDRLKITCCHEVFPHPEPILLQEDCVAILDRRNLKTYPFVLKSDFNNVISDVYASIAKIIEDTKKEVYNGLEGDNYITIEVAADYSTCVISHAESGVTAGDYGDELEEGQTSATPGFGESVKIMSLHVDSQGHITEIEDHLVTIPDTEATQLIHGLMSALDKKKLDEIGIDTTNTTALTPANELFNNVIQLHKIAKTGTFSDLLSIPDGVLTINYPKGDGTTETKTFTDNADTNETVTIPSEIDDTLAQNYKTYSSNKIEDFVNRSIGKGTLIIQKNGTNLPINYSVVPGSSLSKQAFGANDFNYCTVNIPVPTKTSDLTNDGSDAQNPNPYINKDADNLTNYYTKTAVNNLLSELEANIDWKEAVATYSDIATTYPNPQDGWTVSTKDTNNVYRYDDATQTWVNVFSANSNNVEPSVAGVGGHSGLMPATMAEKLNGIEAGAEVNVQPDWNQTTTTADDYIKNKPTIGNGKLTITVNNSNVDKVEFNANQTNDTTFNINTETNVFRTAIEKTGNNVDVLYDNKDWGIGVNSNNQLQINGKFVKQVEDFSDYTNPTVGDVVQYIGNTDNDYTHNYFYEYQELTPTEYEYEITVGPNDYGVPEGVYESQDAPEGYYFYIAYYIGQNGGYYGPPTFLLEVGSKIWKYAEDGGIFTVTSIDSVNNQYTLDSGDIISVAADNIEQSYIYAEHNGDALAINNSGFGARCVANGFPEFQQTNVYYADVQPFLNSTNEGLQGYITIETTSVTPATYGWVQTDVQPTQQLPTLGDLASINTNGDTTQYLRGDGTWATVSSGPTIWEGTLAQYNQISPKDTNTIYLISD